MLLSKEQLETAKHIRNQESCSYTQYRSGVNYSPYPVLCGQSSGWTAGGGIPDRCPGPTVCCCGGKGQQLGSQLSDRPCHTPLGQNSCSQQHPQPCVLIQGDQHTHSHTQQPSMQKINATCLRPRLILLLLPQSLKCVCV